MTFVIGNNMVSKVLILDGDSIAYRCAAAAEERFIRVTHTPTKKQKEYKHRTEFKKSMQGKGKEITEDYLIEDDRVVEPLDHVLSTVKKHIERIENFVKPSETIIYAGEQFNFRLDLPLPSKYKGLRSSAIRPLYLTEAKTYLKSKYKAEEAVGYEVDDACSIAAYESLGQGKQAVMYLYEKDQYQFEGITLLHDTEFFEYETIPELGSLRLEKSAVKGLGLKFLAFQWIWADPVDCYKAYELSNVPFGAKSAYSILNDCKTEQEVLLAVIEQFKTFYPDKFEYKDWKGTHHEGDWLSMLKMYYKCCRMMRSKTDNLDCFDLFNKYGVTI